MKNKLILLIAFLCTCAFAACEGDGDADYGFGKVYMPQAVSTGGLMPYLRAVVTIPTISVLKTVRFE